MLHTILDNTRLDGEYFWDGNLTLVEAVTTFIQTYHPEASEIKISDAADVVAHPAVVVVKPTNPRTFAQIKFQDYLHGLIEEDQVSEEQEVQDLKKKVIESDSNVHFNQFQLYLLESVTPVVALILFTCAPSGQGLKNTTNFE